MTDYCCNICGSIDPKHRQNCEHPSCYNGHDLATARGRPIDDGELNCVVQKKIDSIDQRVIRVDINLAKQPQRSIERNSKLIEQNRKLKVLAEALTSALVPFKSTEMGNLLVDICLYRAVQLPGETPPHERMRHLIDMVDKVLSQADKMLSDDSNLQI